MTDSVQPVLTPQQEEEIATKLAETFNRSKPLVTVYPSDAELGKSYANIQLGKEEINIGIQGSTVVNSSVSL